MCQSKKRYLLPIISHFHAFFRNENSFTKDYDRDFDGVAGDEAAVKKFKEMEDAYNKQKRKK